MGYEFNSLKFRLKPTKNFFNIHSSSKLTAIVSFIVVLQMVAAFDLQCDFIKSSWYKIGEVKNCYAKNLKLNSQYSYIESVNGDSSAKHNDILGFWIDGQTCAFSPQRISFFFPNLQAFGIKDSGLRRLSKFDLAPFPELVRIHFSGNKLEHIDADLFKFNTKVESITITDDHLTFIEPTMFDNLPKLTNLNVELKCFSLKCQSASCIGDVKKGLQENCSNIKVQDYSRLLTYIIEVETSLRTCESELVLRVG